jgi:small GTP-binding protein
MSTDETVKIITLGESSVGKTSILARYVDNIFDINMISTLGVDFKRKTEIIDNKQINIKVWDTAGQECFRNIQKIYYHNTEGVLLVFDLTSKKSFEQLNYWIGNIKVECPSDVAICLVGNKSDLIDEIEVNDDEINNFLKQNNNLKFFKTSAVNGENIKEMFQYISREILEILKKKKADNKNKPKNIKMTKTQFKYKKNICCLKKN